MKKYTSQLSILIIGFLLATATSYLSAWTGAPTNPPNNNTPAPINVGNSNQIKLGTLGLGDLSVFGVGQVSTSSYTLPPKLAFGVNGSVGAREYCDQNGQNCVSAQTIGSGGSSVPVGAIQAFNLTTCPAGWIPANGENGTPDLRGYFIRGFGTNSDGTTSGEFGAKQADEFKSHSHTYENQKYIRQNRAVGPDGWANTARQGAISMDTGKTGGSETRPKNIALLYCQKI